MEEANRLIRACLEKEEPFCASSCPFHYDIREFISRLKRGSFNAAFRTYANAVAFPAIVATLCDEPCKTACPRKETDTAIDLRGLEKASINYALSNKPNSYNMPAKESRIAIIGSGLSGLGCALRLCNRKYQVTIFEQNERIGGQLWDKLPSEVFLKDIETQFMYEKYDLFLGKKITDVKSLLNDYNAVYIATGSGGESFGLLHETKTAGPYASSIPGIFFGGSLAGAKGMESLAQGLNAAALIESWLKTGNMKGAEPHQFTRMKLASGLLTPKKQNCTTGDFTKELAEEEAQRCLTCRCEACYRNCAMMKYFEKFPARIADEVAVTVTPGTLDGNGTVATRLISTCNQCGLCKEVCPEQIDVGFFLQQSHQTMRAKGAMPWVFHDFWLRDMADALSQNFAFIGSPVEKPDYLFFPGCNLGASEPQHVLGAYALLLKAAPNTAIQLGCCGAPAEWAGDVPLRDKACNDIRNQWEKLGKPLMILACPTCKLIFDRYLKEIETVFLSDFFIKLGIKPNSVEKNKEIAVFDPCAIRKNEESQKNIRTLAKEAGYLINELPNHGNTALCCSFGGQIDITNPPYTKWLAKQRTEISELPYLVYCSNCRDVFTSAGKPVTHILELFSGCERKEQTVPGIEQRLLNRRKVKEEIINSYYPNNKNEIQQVKTLPELNLVPGLKEKLNNERIFITDITSVISFCETSRRRLRLPSGHYLGHCEIGYTTYWVEYKPEQNFFTVFNAYSHRMKIDEGNIIKKGGPNE